MDNFVRSFNFSCLLLPHQLLFPIPNMEFQIRSLAQFPENRGRKLLYPIYELTEPGKAISASAEQTTTGRMMTAAKGWASRRGLDWQFKCFTEEGQVYLVRVA